MSSGEPGAELSPRLWPLSAMRQEHFSKGQYLFRVGEKADKLFYLSKGSIRLPELNIVVRSGQVLGEMGIFSMARTRTASAVCEEDLEAFTMGRDEVVQLFARNPALALELMQVSNQRFMENLRAETAAQERIRSELRIAREIQASLLPCRFPPFPERTEFELYATMDPAQEVGGDFYDFFFITRRKLCLVVGDVSGKGVPAALFMALSKTLLRSEALRNYPLPEVLRRVNALLCQDNSLCMFVTVLALVLDIQSGEVQVCNAGHFPPLICNHAGKVTPLTAPPQRVLGFAPDSIYRVSKGRLDPGEVLLLYTDGVTEAANPREELFAETRLRACYRKLRKKKLPEMIAGIHGEIASHACGQPQSDDITLLA
ncbi:MAG: SpoIIE family protein phosphatase, partial [Limisphaerales bacterium]